MSKKHFKATHRESGEVIEFDLGDIHIDKDIDSKECLWLCQRNEEDYEGLFVRDMKHWLKDYDLQYLHNGEYHDYADERSEVKEGRE